MSEPVRPFMRVVANGYTKSGARQLTLIVTPEPATAGAPGSFELSEWPKKMAMLIAGGIGLPGSSKTAGKFAVEIAVAPRAAQSFDGECWTAAEPDIAQPSTLMAIAAIKKLGDPKTSKAWDEINAVWREAFETAGGADPWTDLRKLISHSLEGASFNAALTDEADPAELQPGGRGQMRASAVKPGETVTIKTIIPARQSDLAFQLEIDRAKRVADRIREPLPDLDDLPIEGIAAAPATDLKELSKEQALAELREKKKLELDSVVKATNDDRKQAKQTFDKTTHKLLSRLCKPVSPAELPVQNPGQPESDSPGTAAKTQLYGSWAQAPQTPLEEQKRLERIAQTFYALQGDAGFARLFCLAIDLELEPMEMDPYMFLAAEADEAGRSTPRVWTTAKVADDHFWPAPKDEIDVPGMIQGEKGWEARIMDLITNLDQFDGVSLTGSGAAKGNPRYGLVSLDMRRAVEPTGKDDVINKAEAIANAFQTAGFVVMDRLRADEAIRTAARTAAQKSTKPEEGEQRARALLFAEDLTIGRRLDVAVRKNKVDRWRSLMSRTVSYDFRVKREPKPAVKAALDTLIGAPGSAERREIDAASMVFASRLVPRGSGGADTDAVVEEAVAQWDGTPMAVLCAPERPVPDDAAGKAALPFRRTLGLPDAKNEPASRPPPLRYGVGYRFAMRSTFLGGRAIPLREDGAHLKRQYVANTPQDLESLLAFPAKLTEEPTPASLRRFLRQEAIGRPDVLLPNHIALRSNAPMGFEQADRAALRLNNSEPADGGEFMAGAPYVPASRRANPSSTMRIIVPPTISQDEATRHGVFDTSDFRERLKGGLRDVRRDRQAPNMNDKNASRARRPAGFPIAVTRKPYGFGMIPAEQFREIVYDAPDEQGETVFIAGHDVGERQAFLPDPAAEYYVLRLKHRTTGAYLDGSLTIPVYDGGLSKWPNARPLAIVMSSVNRRPRPKAASEVLAFAKSPDQQLSPSGEFGKTGARVKVVEMKLAPSEDYDLVAFCLPSPEHLAKWFSLTEVLGALVNPMGSPAAPAKLAAMFGDQAAETLQKCLAAQVGDAADCHCSIGGHSGASDDLLLDIAKLLLQHATCVRPIDELSAVAPVRVACAASRPASAPRWAVSPLPGGFDQAIAAVQWIGEGASGKYLARNLFGAADAVRPAAIAAQTTEGAKRHIEALALARDVFRPATAVGSKDYLLTGAISIDLTDADGFEIVAETVAPRSSVMDDISRRRSLKARRAGRWPSLLDEAGKRRFSSVLDVYGFADIDDRNRVSLQRSEVTLLRCEALPAEGATPLWPQWEGNSTISLAMVHEAARRGLVVLNKEEATPRKPAGSGQVRRLMFKSDQVHTFPDAKARRLVVKAVAFSRFAADWETVDRWRGPKEPTQQELGRRQPLNRKQQIRESLPHEIWLPASERPAKCVVRSPMPVFRTERLTVDKQGLVVHTLKRSAVTRIYLSRGWFSSGEGERLGVVAWPPNHFDELEASLSRKLGDYYKRSVALDELSDEFVGPGGAFITRWGGDPIRWDSAPSTEPLIGPYNFADVAHLIHRPQDPPIPPDILQRLNNSPHDPRIVRNVKMPIARADDEDSATAADQDSAKLKLDMMDVSLITYEPCFDADREEWFVDIEITPSRSTDPFVRFGLVRYQEHTEPDLQVSEPVVAWSQILPGRTAEVTPIRGEKGGLMVFASVFGQASERVKHHKRYEKAGHPIYDALDKPQMRMSVVHEGKDNGNRWRRTPVNAAEFHAFDNNPHIADGVGRWNLQCSIDAERLAQLGPGRFYAYLEEIEQRMPATYPAEPISPETMFEPNTLVDSGPRFSARIAFDLPMESASAPPKMQPEDATSK